MHLRPSREPGAGGAPATEAETAASCERDQALLAETRQSLRIDPERILPWVIPPTAEQVATVRIADDRLDAPMEGNPWAACIQRNDILWTPRVPPNLAFARRVLSIERMPGTSCWTRETPG